MTKEDIEQMRLEDVRHLMDPDHDASPCDDCAYLENRGDYYRCTAGMSPPAVQRAGKCDKQQEVARG